MNRGEGWMMQISRGFASVRSFCKDLLTTLKPPIHNGALVAKAGHDHYLGTPKPLGEIGSGYLHTWVVASNGNC